MLEIIDTKFEEINKKRMARTFDKQAEKYNT